MKILLSSVVVLTLSGCAGFDTAGTVSGNLDKATAVTAEGLKETILIRCNELSEVRRKNTSCRSEQTFGGEAN